MSKNYKVYYYYYDMNEAVYMTDEDDEVRRCDLQEIFHEKSHQFSMLQGYDNTESDLKRFKKDFNILCDALKKVSIKTKSSKYFSIKYKKYFNHNDAVLYNWKAYHKAETLKKFERVSKTEFYIMERCYNSGLITLNLDYKEKPVMCYSRDFSSYYSNLLINMKIPYREGKVYNLDSVEYGKLKYGIYRVEINYTNNQFTNVFNFSQDNHYTSTLLNSVYKYKDYFGLTFKLLKVDDEYDYNALIWDYDDLMDGDKLFGEWLKDMLSVKEKLPKNKLVKHLISTIGGTLASFKNLYFDDFNDLDLTRINSTVDSEYKLRKITNSGTYKCVKSDEAYKYNFARIKPFLVSLGRKKMFELVMKNNLIDKLVAIHTDRLTLIEDFNFSIKNKYYPTPEEKSSGKIIFYNAIHYRHICNKCDKEYANYEKHEC